MKLSQWSCLMAGAILATALWQLADRWSDPAVLAWRTVVQPELQSTSRDGRHHVPVELHALLPNTNQAWSTLLLSGGR